MSDMYDGTGNYLTILVSASEANGQPKNPTAVYRTCSIALRGKKNNSS